MSLTLNVVTPEKEMVHGLPVEKVILPGKEGQIMVLPLHASLLTSLTSGTFAYENNGNWTWAALSGGFARVEGDKVVVLAESVELAKEIDSTRAELALKRAQEKLKEENTPENLMAQERAKTRLEVFNRYR